MNKVYILVKNENRNIAISTMLLVILLWTPPKNFKKNIKKLLTFYVKGYILIKVKESQSQK